MMDRMEIALILSIAVISVGACVACYYYEEDSSPHYEVELESGEVYRCVSFQSYWDGITTLHDVNNTSKDVRVFSHLIVRCEQI